MGSPRVSSMKEGYRLNKTKATFPKNSRTRDGVRLSEIVKSARLEAKGTVQNGGKERL